MPTTITNTSKSLLTLSARVFANVANLGVVTKFKISQTDSPSDLGLRFLLVLFSNFDHVEQAVELHVLLGFVHCHVRYDLPSSVK